MTPRERSPGRGGGGGELLGMELGKPEAKQADQGGRPRGALGARRAETHQPEVPVLSAAVWEVGAAPQCRRPLFFFVFFLFLLHQHLLPLLFLWQQNLGFL